jgi:hypothetical protein
LERYFEGRQTDFPTRPLRRTRRHAELQFMSRYFSRYFSFVCAHGATNESPLADNADAVRNGFPTASPDTLDKNLRPKRQSRSTCNLSNVKTLGLIQAVRVTVPACLQSGTRIAGSVFALVAKVPRRARKLLTDRHRSLEHHPTLIGVSQIADVYFDVRKIVL